MVIVTARRNRHEVQFPMSRLWLSLFLVVSVGVAFTQADPTTGLPPIPWPVPNDNAPPKPAVPQRMVPLQPMFPAPVALKPPPLLYLRFAGPAGSHVTFYRDGRVPDKLSLPAVVGFRPGYQYRCAVSGIPGRPGVTYYPTIEVRGSIALNHKLRGADYPGIINFLDDDLDKLAAGTMIQKIVVLERPENALPEQSEPNKPLEVTVLPGQDPFTEARERGLPLAYVFLGQRTLDPEEMTAIPGTIYIDGDRSLPMPARMPTVPWTCYPLVDPTLGLVHPSEYVSIFDGGDSNLPAGFDGRGKLRGVDPSDTVAEYVSSKGAKKLAISNRVALCIPRYIMVRSEVTPNVRGAGANPEIALGQKMTGVVESHRELIERVQKLQLEVAKQTARPSGIEAAYGTVVVGAVKSTKVTASIQTPETLNGAKIPSRAPEDGPLLIDKWPDRLVALIGDLVTFTLRYRNTGRQPIQNIVVVDNLTPRFEYVPGTAKTDRDGTFTFQPNQAGSHLLRWEFSGELPPGESGLITFQVRVR
jgi:uncharacterized repeat protein (TIGR01451 family)